MKKRILAFLVAVIIKCILLYFIVVTIDTASLLELLIRFVAYFLITGWLDYKILRYLKRRMKDPNWIFLASFSYATYVLIVWMVVVAVEVYKSNVSPQQMGHSRFSTTTIFLFVLLGFFTSAIVATIITVRANKRMSKTGRTARSIR